MSGQFLAVDLAGEERHRLATVLGDSGISDRLSGRRVPIANWHITVRFLGEVTDVQGETLMGRLDETLAVDSHRVWLDGIGAFPKPSKASVAFCSIDDPADVLGLLAALCDEAAVDVGLEPEDRSFVPHLSLSRIRPPMDLRKVIDSIEFQRIPIEVTSVTLMRTTSVRGGVRYDRVDRIDL
jgi:2'-5' RNA ligase